MHSTQHAILDIINTTQENMGKWLSHVVYLSFGHSPNGEIEMACFDAKLQEACNACQGKKGK